MEEFTTSTGFKIFYCAIALFMIGFSLFLFTMDHSKAGNSVLAIPILIIIFAFLIIATQFIRKVIISTDSIVSINVFGKKEIPTSNVKGCRIGQKVISIESTLPSTRKITINNYLDLANSEDLKKWLKENFNDLDALDLEAERNKVLHDIELGATPDEREAKITGAKRIAGIYNAVGLFVGFVSIPFDKQIPIVIVVILYPLIGVLIMFKSSGLIKFLSNNKRSIYSLAAIGLMTPSITLCIEAFLGYDIDDYQRGILLALTICLPTTALFYLVGLNRNIGSFVGQIVMMFIVSLIYGYGTIIKINCMLDKTEPHTIQTTITDLDIRHNKGTHYYLWLKSWQANQAPKSVEVSSDTFYEYHVGSNINIHVKKGLLNIPWYYL